MAGEVEPPGKTFPTALLSSVAMTSLGYLLPLMAATGAIDAPPEDWGNGFFADAAGDDFNQQRITHLLHYFYSLVSCDVTFFSRFSCRARATRYKFFIYFLLAIDNGACSRGPWAGWMDFSNDFVSVVVLVMTQGNVGEETALG